MKEYACVKGPPTPELRSLTDTVNEPHTGFILFVDACNYSKGHVEE